MSRKRGFLVRRVLLCLLLLAPVVLAALPKDATQSSPELEPETWNDLILHLSGGEATELWMWRDAAWEVVPLAAPPDAPSGHFMAPESCFPGTLALVVGETRVSAPWTLTEDRCQRQESLELPLLPRATVAGKLTVAEGETLPQTAELRVDRCADPGEARGAATLAHFPLAISELGAWVSPVPAGCVHLTVNAGDYAALSWWGLGLETGDREELQARRLIAGSSVLAGVISGTDGRALQDVRVELWPETETRALWRERGPKSSLKTAPVITGITGPWGWVRLPGLEPGHYALRLEAPSGAFTVTPPFELTQHEAVFEGLEIPPPARLEIAPEIEIEQLRVGRFSVWATPAVDGDELHDGARTVVAPAGESLVLEGLHPGIWKVRLSWGLEEFEEQELAQETVTLLPGEHRWLAMTVELPLYRGDVRYRGEPIEGTIAFRPRSRDLEAIDYPTTRSDAEGEFALFLPGAGIYQIHVEDEERRAMLARFEVGEPDEPLHVRLPEGRIEGWVIDEEGRPAPPGVVEARRLDLFDEDLDPAILRQSASTREDGTFALEALAEGTWDVQAVSEPLRSSTQSLSLGPDQVISGIELVLGERYQLSGRAITDTGRPVAGATGWLTLDLRDGISAAQKFQTGTDGGFSLDLPDRPRYPFYVALAAPGLPWSATRQPPAEWIELVLPEIGGRVELTLRGEEMSTRSLGGFVLQREDGGLLPPDLFGDSGQVGDNERTVVFPSLAPGHWRLVFVGSLEEALALMRGIAVPALTSFYVQPGQTVQVEAAMPNPP